MSPKGPDQDQTAQIFGHFRIELRNMVAGPEQNGLIRVIAHHRKRVPDTIERFLLVDLIPSEIG